MPSLQELENAIVEADKQGNVEDAKVLASAIISKRD